MKDCSRLVLALVAFAFGWNAVAAERPIAPGENILNNATLEFGEEGGPLDWNLSYEKVLSGADFVTVEGTNVIRFKPRKGETTIVQSGIALKEGSKVRVGAWVRTKGFVASAHGVIIYNWAWKQSDGSAWPRDTRGEWVKVEKEVVVPASSNKRYTFAIYTVNMTEGVVEVRDPYLEAVDEDSAAAVTRAPSFCELGVVTPVAPLLSQIPAGTAELQFSFINRVKRGRCAIGVRMDGEESFRPCGEFALENDRIVAKVSGLKPGRGVLMATMRDESGREVARSEYPIRVVEPVRYAPGRPLNGLVTRLLTETAKDGNFGFEMPKEGWVWIRLANGTAATKVSLDGVEVIRARDGEGFETLRHVAAGRHGLTVAGADGGEMIVNKVPVTSTYTYPLPIPQLACYKEYAGDFLRRRIFPAICIFSGGYNWRTMPKDELADFRFRGKEYYSQANRNGSVEPPEKLVKRLGMDALQPDSIVVGRTFDEIDIGSVGDKMEYAKGMRLLAGAELPMATWSSGYTFTYNALNAEYLSACVNEGNGRGIFQFECYPYLQSNEAEGQADLDKMLNDSIRRAKRLVPGVLDNSWIVLGSYTRLDHALNYDDCVESDYKRHVDLYLNRLATDPEFAGLAGVGLYCFHNAEEEDLRWLLDLFRHYLLEGRTDRPSDRLGYVYNPGHLTNGNFAKGLDDWKVKPAEEGSISTRRIKGLPKLFRYRDSCHDGDSACILRRSRQGANALGKELTGLKPGKVYSLRYAVASVKDLEDKDAKPEPRDFGVKAVLSDVEDLTAVSPLERINGAKRDLPKLNVRFIVFRALKPTARLGFFDTKATDDAGAGEELALSAVRVKPYYVGTENLQTQKTGKGE